MPSTNSHGTKRAILYARVSTDEQAKSGYSLAQQMEALREYATHVGYEVLEEVMDPGQSGASLARPGMDRVRDLVAADGVSVVVAQDADRITRDPIHRAFLDEEMEQFGTRLMALDDWGDDSHEGELLRYMKGWVSKGERLKTAERTRRGKLRKAREGKVIAAKRPHYGFRYNEARDSYVVDEGEMAVAARIFRMVGTEGVAVRRVKRTFEREGLPTPEGKRHWGQFFIRECILDDIYKPHVPEEIEALVARGQMSAEVAARLDPEKRYGIWWFNRRKTKTYQEAVNESSGAGKTYKRRVKISERPESEWIAVPVPDSGIPREWVDLAREAMKNNVKISRNDRRPWELSGGLARCAECGWALSTISVKSSGSHKMNHYYRCSRVSAQYDYSTCTHRKHHRADNLEPMVWEYVSGAMKDPETLRADLDRYIELERKGQRSSGDPTREARLWAERLVEVEHKRAKYQEMAAEDLITFEELRTRLSELDEARKTAEGELATLRGREEHVRNLERYRDALLDSLEAEAPEALDALTPEQRHQWYRLLRLRAEVRADGTVEVSWAGAPASEAVCETATLSPLRVRLV